MISTLGAGSGINTSALAVSLVDGQRVPAKALIQNRINIAQNSISGYAAISYVIDNLKTAFADLKDQSDFASLAPSISQPSALSVAAGATTAAGSHSVTVTTLAAAQRNISAGFAAKTSLNNGVPFNLSLSVHGDTATTIAVTETTLPGIAAAINSANLGVSASLIKTGNTSTPYKIVVTGTSGADYDFTLTADNVPSCVTAVTTPGAVPPVGGQGVTETTALGFTTLYAGQSVTIGGLTYTATKDTVAADLASAFASLAVGATTGAGTAKGTYSGALTGFSTGAVTNGTVTASSSTANADVANLVVTQTGFSFGATNPPQTACDAALIVDGVEITSSSNQVRGAITGATLNLNGTTTSGTAATLNFTRDTASVTSKLQALVTAYNDANSMLGVVSDPKSSVATYGATLVGNSIVSQVRDQIRNIMLPNVTSSSGSITSLRDLGVSIEKTGVLTLDTGKLNTVLDSNFDQVVTMLSANRENLSTLSPLTAGVAGEAVKKLTTMLASTSSITTQSDNATKKISDYNKDLAKLEARMTMLLERYTKQFAAMDSIVGQSNSLRTSLTSTFDGMMSMYTNK